MQRRFACSGDATPIQPRLADREPGLLYLRRVVRRLPPDAQAFDQAAIAAFVLALHIIEQPAPAAHKLKQTAA